jgi:hypothetical protein
MKTLKAILLSLVFASMAYGADAVTTKVLLETKTHYIAHFTNVSDGTGESDVKKVDKSTISVATDGAEPGSLDIDAVAWNCDGMSVRVEWDHTTDDLALALSGFNPMLNFKSLIGLNVPGFISTAGLKDPRTTGDTGDIFFTTVGHTSGDTYNITLWLRKNPD